MRSGSRFSLSVLGIVGAAALAGVMGAACSATGRGSEFDGSTESGAGGTGNGSAGNGGNGGDGGGFIPAGAGGGNQGAGGGDSCAATKNKAEQVPLDMFIMLDRSSSMDDSNSPTKWQSATNALKSFVAQPAATGIGVGIQYFPLDSGLMCSPIPFCATDADCGPAGCGPCFLGICTGSAGDSCNPGDYAKPSVPIAPLPAVGTTIVSSINAQSPAGSSTPTTPALQGAVDYAKQWALQNPSHTVIAVLATDGDPTGCSTNSVDSVKSVASAAANGVPSIKTFVIGVGSQLTALNGIAAAGGTISAFLIDTNQNAADQFLQAMNEIRGAALSCSYLIPQPPAGEDIDYNAINVEYTPESGISIIVPQVKSAAECPAAGLAWYYDNPGSPQQIVFCDATCTQIAQDAKAEVDILVGCATIVK